MRAYLDAAETMFGDVELPEAIQLGEVRERLPRPVDLVPAPGVPTEPPFATELQHADPRDTGEPPALVGPLVVNGVAWSYEHEPITGPRADQ